MANLVSGIFSKKGRQQTPQCLLVTRWLAKARGAAFPQAERRHTKVIYQRASSVSLAVPTKSKISQEKCLPFLLGGCTQWNFANLHSGCEARPLELTSQVPWDFFLIIDCRRSSVFVCFTLSFSFSFIFLLLFFLFLFISKYRVSICRPGLPGRNYVDQTDLGFNGLELKTWAVIPALE